MERRIIAAAVMLACTFGMATTRAGELSAIEEIAKYRAALQEGNPADLWEARGEALWKEKRGPKNASLEQCDLGKGPGVVKGAYAELPRYFADGDRVMDLETRLVHCMVSLQGYTSADATRTPYGSPGKRSDFEALAAWISAESRGMPMRIALAHPKEKEAHAIGEKMFFMRAGPHDFACATCHAESGKRIRLQELPNLTERVDAQKAYTTWPAYRVSQGEVRTMQWRMNDCARQQRLPYLKFGSEGAVALITYLAKNAEGGAMDAPALKR